MTDAKEEAKFADREITNLGQLCTFELLENKSVDGAPINRFRTQVGYSTVRGINPGEGVTYRETLYVGGRIGGSSARHIWIPGPFPEVSYYEMPGQNDGLIIAETPEQVQQVRLATATFVKRRLAKEGVFSETIDLAVSDPRFDEFAKPKHMAFLINGNFNYVVGQLNFEVSGYGKPVDRK